MIKIPGLILIVISCFSVGLYLSARLKYRLEFLSSFKEFLSSLEINIRYNCLEIIPLIKASAPVNITDIFSDENDGSFLDYWNNSINNIPKKFALKEEDLKLLYEFGRTLGTTDIEGQLNHIILYKNLIEANIDNSKKELKQKSKLYKTLGLFTGLSIALLLL